MMFIKAYIKHHTQSRSEKGKVALAGPTDLKAIPYIHNSMWKTKPVKVFVDEESHDLVKCVCNNRGCGSFLCL